VRWFGLAIAGLVILAAVAIGVASLLGRGATAETSSAPSADVGGTASPSASVPPSAAIASRRPPTAEERAFADAYLELAEAFNREATDLMIANPLAEWDLVGTRLTELVAGTRGQLAGLPPLPLTDVAVRRLDDEIAATVALLEAVDPHGAQSEQTTAYLRALDYWVAHVQPVSGEIRAALGLPPVSTGDLAL
jgi:hypothetical protein